MNTQPRYLADWTPQQYNVLEKAVLTAKHRIHETGLFSDEALIDLIDNYPNDYLTIAAMGSEASKFEWMVGDRNEVSAADLLSAVRNGKLWVNLIQLTRFSEEHRKLVDSVYDELEAANPKFKARHRSANILISSPQAMVYFHVDLPVNMLWHLRGQKKVWVFPYDERFVSQVNMERLAAGKMSEDMPYEDWYEDFALTFEVKPGDLITWPQNTPHMVKNLDGLNVSLSTEHRHPLAKRAIMVHAANYHLRSRFGLQNLSSSPHGMAAHLKQAGVRAAGLWQRLVARKEQEVFDFKHKFYVDPSAPQGYQLYDPSKSEENEPSAAMMM